MTRLSALSILLLSVAANARAAMPPALTVAAVTGTAEVERLGVRHPVKVGESIDVRDVVSTSARSRLALAMSDGGRLELAAGSTLGVEQLPQSTSQAHTLPKPVIFTLQEGAMHLNWQPQHGDAAPVYVFYDGQRVALAPGEYVLETTATRDRLCVGQGQATRLQLSLGEPVPVPAQSCVVGSQRIAAGAAMWTALRAPFEIDDAPVSRTTVASAVTDAAVASRSATSADDGDNDSHWVINVASYSDADAARAQQQRLASQGYRAAVTPADVDGRTWYRVRVTGFDSAAAARSTAVALQDVTGGSHPWIVQQP